jgi:hypothetical protein
MITQMLAPVHFLPRPQMNRTRVATAPPGSRRKSARAAVWSGVVAFMLLTVGMAAAVDTVVREWRDPEFAHRLIALQKWKEKAPQRPLVVAFGSSRTQMGFSPAAMGFPDEPGSPIVYNCGYRGSPPLGSYMHLLRLLDSGVKPDAVLIQLAPLELRIPGEAERQLAPWTPRLSAGDASRLAPYTEDPNYWRQTWAKSHLLPWQTYHQAVLSHLIPAWQTPLQQITYIWEQMDEYGFTPHFLQDISAEERSKALQTSKEHHGSFLAGELSIEPRTMQLYRDLVGRCRTEGIPVAFFWIPESPIYLSWHVPSFRAETEQFGKQLETELGVLIFPAPTHLDETDFVDGYHLRKVGAEKYSRWLADVYLRPWLQSLGLAKN